MKLLMTFEDSCYDQAFGISSGCSTWVLIPWFAG